MLEVARAAALLAATVTVGLMAGLYLAFSYAVMTGLARTDDRTFVGAMHHINVAILNGWFFVIFFGSVAFPVVATLLHLGGEARRVLLWLAAGTVLSLAGFGITISRNVPLNNQLDAAGQPDQVTDHAAVRGRFEQPWSRWNLIRGLITTVAFVCLLWALVVSGQVW